MATNVLETGYDVDYDLHLDRWCLHYQGEIICLGAPDFDGAMLEAENILNQWWG